jgi:hypothetical protein
MFRSQVVAATDSAKAAIDVFADVDDDHSAGGGYG